MSVLSGSSTANNGVILTVPANTTWFGSVTLSGSLAVGVNGGVSVSLPSVKTVGAAPDLPDGSVVAQLALAAPAIGLVSLLGASTALSVTIPNVVIPAGVTPVELRLYHSSAQAATGTAFGLY